MKTVVAFELLLSLLVCLVTVEAPKMSQDTPALLSMTQVCKLTTLSRTMVNKYRLAGNFPKAVPIGEKRIAFVASEIHEWILERMSRRTAA